jgi:hypothetical protein
MPQLLACCAAAAAAAALFTRLLAAVIKLPSFAKRDLPWSIWLLHHFCFLHALCAVLSAGIFLLSCFMALHHASWHYVMASWSAAAVVHHSSSSSNRMQHVL